MTDNYLICPSCGWLYLSMSEEGRVPVCRRPGCRCRILRQATAEERAVLPIGATVQSPKQDLLLKDSRRFRAVQNGGVFEVYDDNFDARKPILVGADEIDGMTEGYLMTVTPAREVEVVINGRWGGFSLSEPHVRALRLTGVADPKKLERDDPRLVFVVRTIGTDGKARTIPTPFGKDAGDLRVVTIPASWCAGDSDLHEAGWYIADFDGVEEVCMRVPRLRADGTIYLPAPKSVIGRPKET